MIPHGARGEFLSGPVPLGELPPPPPGRTGWPWTIADDGRGSRNNDQLPSITVVTPSFQQGLFLEETIRSVLLQNYPRFEYIVIDGGSTDGSRSIIEKYSPWLRYWVSEKDTGQPQAINKGIAHSRGELFNWLNSGDSLTPGALRRVGEAAAGADVVAGAVVETDGSGERVVHNSALSAEALLASAPGTLYHQPGFWVRREHIAESGGIDEGLHYTFCWDLAIRYLHRFPAVAYVGEPLVRFRLHPDSKTVALQDRFAGDRVAAMRKIASLPEFAPLHRLASRMATRRSIYEEIDRTLSREHVFAGFLRLASHHPRALTTRYLWGAMRRTLLQKQRN